MKSSQTYIATRCALIGQITTVATVASLWVESGIEFVGGILLFKIRQSQMETVKL